MSLAYLQNYNEYGPGYVNRYEGAYSPMVTRTTTPYVGSGGGPVNSPSGSGGGGGGASYSPSTSVSTTTSSGGSTSKTWYSGKVDAKTQAKYDEYSRDYVQGDTVTQAYNKLQETLNNKPGDFTSQYTDQLNSLYDSIVNREAFKYNQNEDVLYGVYKGRFNEAGQSAMEDTTGQMAAATGGYANTAAASAGQQAYQSYMDQLNDTALNLHNQAYQRYQDEGTMLQNKFNVTKNLYDTDYNQYRDQVSDWQADRDYYQGTYEAERDFDYNKFTNDRNYWTDEYWNQKKAETTTESSWWSTSTTVTTS